MSRRTKLKRQALAAVILADKGQLRVFNTKRKIAIEVESRQGTSRVNLDQDAVKAVMRRLAALVRDKKVWQEPAPPKEVPKQKVGLLPSRGVKPKPPNERLAKFLYTNTRSSS